MLNNRCKVLKNALILLVVFFLSIQSTSVNAENNSDSNYEQDLETVDGKEVVDCNEKVSLNQEDHDFDCENKEENDNKILEEDIDNDELDRDRPSLMKQKINDKVVPNTHSDTEVNLPLTLGDQSPYTKNIKLDLMRVGFGTHWTNPTELYGPDTVNVVKQFQDYYSVTSDAYGEFGQNSLNILTKVLDSPYQKGNRSDEILEIKLRLMKLGFGTHWTNPTTYYGSDTENVVKEFQEVNGLVVNGIIDEVTMDKIHHLESLGFGLGMRSPEIKQIKLDLMKVGFGTHWTNPTTYYGPDTEKVVRDFQSYYSIKGEDGRFGEKSKAKLLEILSSPYRLGNRSEEILEWKHKLVTLGFGTHWTNPTTYYGPDTENVVKELQDSNGLAVNGILDDVTRQFIEEILESGFKIGTRSPLILEFKKDLMKVGFGAHWKNPTTYLGSDTEKEIKAFQNYYSINVNGRVNEQTIEKMNSILSSKFQRGKQSESIKELKHDLMRVGYGLHWTNPSALYGPDTESVVRKFQKDYDLVVNGIVDEVTLQKLNEFLDLGYKEGDRSEEIVELKNKLMKAGFGTHWTNPTTYYGSDTVKVVKEFQKYYSLFEDGEMHFASLNKLDEVINSHYQRGNESEDIRKIKLKLKEIGFGTHWKNPTKLYGPDTEKVVREFQRAYSLVENGIVDEITLAKIEELWKLINYTRYNISLEDALKLQMNVNPQTDKYYAWVSKQHISNGKVTATSLNVRVGPGTNYNKFKNTLKNGTEVKVLGEYNGWYAIDYPEYSWVTALPEDVLYYLNPYNFSDDSVQRFQFLNLSKTSDAKSSDLNKVLKGVLKGKGNVFKRAGKDYNVNDVYLVSHALLETGNGTSKLAQGVEVGINSKNKLELVTPENKSRLNKIKKVHNVYGIGAYDNCALECGAKRAYEEGWTNVDKAIIGGAKFVAEKYIAQGQNTLYKMRWNPDAMVTSGAASHQYATDIGWAFKQVSRIYELYNELGIDPTLDIPVYK